jgi:MFS family permease
MAGVRSSLRVPGFGALLGSYVVNRAGDVVGALALAIVVLGITGSALATSLLFLATQFAPGLIGPALVARIDRIAPGRILPPLYLVECVLFGSLAALVHHSGIAPLIVLAFLDATLAFAARTVTRSAAASMLIPHDLMPEGKAAFNVALAAAMIGGPVVAGLAVSVFDPSTALLIDAGSFLAAAVVIALVPALRAAPASDTDRPDERPSARGRLREGIAYIARNPSLRALIGGEGVAFVFFYLVVPVTVVYSTESLHAGAGGYAALLGSWGVGIAIGSAVQVRLARRVGVNAILVSTGAVAAGYLGTAFAPTLIVACAASVIGGIGNGTQWASVETALHRLVDEAFRARTTAVLEALASIAPGVGILLGGTLTALLSPRAAYLVAGAGLVGLIAAAKLTGFSFGARPIEPPVPAAP